MKKTIFSTISAIGLTILLGGSVLAQGHATREEAEGKVVWEKLQAKQVQCSDLSNDNFEALGDR